MSSIPQFDKLGVIRLPASIFGLDAVDGESGLLPICNQLDVKRRKGKGWLAVKVYPSSDERRQHLMKRLRGRSQRGVKVVRDVSKALFLRLTKPEYEDAHGLLFIKLDGIGEFAAHYFYRLVAETGEFPCRPGDRFGQGVNQAWEQDAHEAISAALNRQMKRLRFEQSESHVRVLPDMDFRA